MLYVYNITYRTTKSEKSRDNLGYILLLPEIDCLKDINVCHAVILECFLEPIERDKLDQNRTRWKVKKVKKIKKVSIIVSLHVNILHHLELSAASVDLLN